MKKSKLYISIFGIILGLSISSHAQTTPESGTLGLRASITGQQSVEVPYMFSESFSLAPYLGFDATENSTTNITIGVRPRYYLGNTNSLSTYATGILGFSNTSFSNANNSNTNFDLGAGYGAEYFFSNNFSLSADANLSTRFGDSATNVGTSVRVSASFYF